MNLKRAKNLRKIARMALTSIVPDVAYSETNVREIPYVVNKDVIICSRNPHARVDLESIDPNMPFMLIYLDKYTRVLDKSIRKAYHMLKNGEVSVSDAVIANG